MNEYHSKIQKFTLPLIKFNRSARKACGRFIHIEGCSFLERLRKECGLGATPDELAEEREQLRLSTTTEEVSRPELTVEYLKSIGAESYAYYGNSAA